jgi:hypothetical protein
MLAIARELAAEVLSQRRGDFMRGITFLALAAVAAIGFTVTTPKATAQVGVEIGAAPDCPYGYYDSTPYGCAPYGYYGPDWFSGGIFIGAGPWFHGPSGFQGHVNNRLHPDHGYKGAAPQRGEKAEPAKIASNAHSFKGNEVRDGHGAVGKGARK